MSKLVAGALAWFACVTPAHAGTLQDHVPGKGATLSREDWFELDFSLYFSIRYLNQLALDDDLDRRHDLQFQKVLLYFKGWLANERLRYLTYVWTSNPNMGRDAQVVVGGNLTYELAEYATVGAGIGSLPTTRTTRGSFPGWLRVDARTNADEYFRGSYTSGFWLTGSVAQQQLHYLAMLGNNLSQLGVDAAQLDNSFRTVSGAVWWTSFGYGGLILGDLEDHRCPVFTAGAAFTYSREDAESQPDTDAFENTQLRVSSGNVIFEPGLFAAGTSIQSASYWMGALDAGLKYRGFSLDAELFVRRIDGFAATGPLPFDALSDWGFQVQASAMPIHKRLMAYAFGSLIEGEYGDPWDAGIGINYFPFGTRVLRLNAELIRVKDSPVGNLSSPMLVDADGFVVVANAEVLY